MMIWILLAGLSGVAVVGVAAWARRVRGRTELETAERRERARLQMEEAQLLAKLQRSKEE